MSALPPCDDGNDADNKNMCQYGEQKVQSAKARITVVFSELAL